jgi:hypothetical protein
MLLKKNHILEMGLPVVCLQFLFFPADSGFTEARQFESWDPLVHVRVIVLLSSGRPRHGLRHMWTAIELTQFARMLSLTSSPVPLDRIHLRLNRHPRRMNSSIGRFDIRKSKQRFRSCFPPLKILKGLQPGHRFISSNLARPMANTFSLTSANSCWGHVSLIRFSEAMTILHIGAIRSQSC